ncbi:MAG: hypothetical protein ABGY41_09720, partial [Candidatus Poribacteria bacterium]
PPASPQPTATRPAVKPPEAAPRPVPRAETKPAPQRAAVSRPPQLEQVEPTPEEVAAAATRPPAQTRRERPPQTSDAASPNVSNEAPVPDTPSSVDDVESGPTPAVEPVGEREPLTAEGLETIWKVAVETLAQRDGPLAGPLHEATPSVRGDTIVLSFRSMINLNSAKSKAAMIDEVLGEIMGAPRPVVFTIGDDAQTGRAERVEEEAASDKRDEQEQLVLQVFSGKIEELPE